VHHTIHRIITAVVCGTIWDREGCIRMEGTLWYFKIDTGEKSGPVGASIDLSKSLRKNDRLAVALV